MKEPQGRAEEGEKEGEGEGAVPVWDYGSPLYDSFELASLCHLLDRHQMALPFSRESSAPRHSGRVCDELDEMPWEKITAVVVGSRGREEKAMKRTKAQRLRALFRALAFWSKT